MIYLTIAQYCANYIPRTNVLGGGGGGTMAHTMV